MIIIGHFSHIVWRRCNFGHRGFAGLVLWGHVVSATRWTRGLGPWALRRCGTGVGRWDGIITESVPGRFLMGVVEVNPQKKIYVFNFHKLEFWVSGLDSCKGSPSNSSLDSGLWGFRTTKAKNHLLYTLVDRQFFGQEMDAMNDWIRCFAGVLDATYKATTKDVEEATTQLPHSMFPWAVGGLNAAATTAETATEEVAQSASGSMAWGWALGAGVWLHPPPTSNDWSWFSTKNCNFGLANV